MIHFIRTDHIGRPVLATDSTGTVVWTASYDPFGTVQASTGTPTAIRFPGQWFQAESGLHQNWMRDYDPTTGRYVQADPLGLVDGASVYGYARQNPGRWTDPRGEFTLGDAARSLVARGNRPGVEGFSDTQIFDEWLRLERTSLDWLDELATCPCRLDDFDATIWQPPVSWPEGVPFHPGGYHDMRQIPTLGGHASQCVYDKNRQLIRHPLGAGSADYAAFSGAVWEVIRGGPHFDHDVRPFEMSRDLGREEDYYDVRPVK